jgi:flagellar FliJ protein
VKPFRLVGLQRLRQLQEDQAAAELAERARDRQRSQARARQALDDLAGNELTSGDIHSWRASVAARVALTGALLDAESASEVAAYREGDARQSWSAARQRSVTLERLADRHEVAQQQEQDRSEQKALDELATQRAVRARLTPKDQR